MAIKRKIHEYCQLCGKLAAWRDGNMIVGDHECTERLPNRPRDPPHYFHETAVQFISREPDTKQGVGDQSK